MNELRIKETINLFKSRKVEFEKIKMKMHCCFGEYKEENIVKLDIIGKLNIGLIDFTSLDFEKLKYVNYEDKSEIVKIIMGKLNDEMSLVYDLSIILTSEKGYVIQHELQHAFDFFINIDDGKVAQEYRAYLAGLKYGGEPIEHLNQIYSSVNEHIRDGTLLTITENDRANYLAMAKIVRFFSKQKGLLGPERIVDMSSKLLDESYEDNYGVGYDEIVEVMLKTNRPYDG